MKNLVMTDIQYMKHATEQALLSATCCSEHYLAGVR